MYIQESEKQLVRTRGIHYLRTLSPLWTQRYLHDCYARLFDQAFQWHWSLCSRQCLQTRRVECRDMSPVGNNKIEEISSDVDKNVVPENQTLTVMFPMISNCRPVGPTNLHITSSTVAVCTWKRSWSLGNVDSSTLISCFKTFRQAIIGRASTPRRSDHVDRSKAHSCAHTHRTTPSTATHGLNHGPRHTR